MREALGLVALLVVCLAVMFGIRSCAEDECLDKGGTPAHVGARDPGAVICVDDEGRIIP